MSGESHQNSVKTSAECRSTMTTCGTGMLTNNDVDNIREVANARGTYADAVRTPSGKENVRKGMDVGLVNPEGQALGRPSNKSQMRITKI